MPVMTGNPLERFELVTAAHEFILTVLPFRHCDSRTALTSFVEAAGGSPLRIPELDAVLLNVLSVLEPHTGGRLPSLVDRYLIQRRRLSDPVERFRECVEDVIRYKGVGSREVQQAIAIIRERYCDSTLTQAAVADAVGLLPQELSALYIRQTGMTFAEYVRDLRLDRAARLLATTDARIKEIWAGVGYNDASNFSHQFKERFGSSPREYRARAIHAAMAAVVGEPDTTDDYPADRREAPPCVVLIVDDNECTRDTLGRHLQDAGYSVVLAEDGQSALRQVRRARPDAIVLDHHLPDMDGLECLRLVRADDGSGSPAVLLFTADWDVADHGQEILQLSAVLASKLCDLDEVERLLRSLLTLRAHSSRPNGKRTTAFTGSA